MSNQSILIVDDNELFRNTVSMIFAGLNFDVLIANDGVEALRVLSRLAVLPVVIISDVEMPNMSGIDLFRRVKSIEALTKIPFVFCSGSVEDVRKDAEELKAEGYVIKTRFCEDLIPLVEKLTISFKPAKP